MKISTLALFVALLCFSFSSHAQTLKCKISDATAGSVFTPYVGGAVEVDTQTGNTQFFAPDAPAEEVFPVISSEAVSSFRASRAGCFFGTETLHRADGSIRGMLLKFNSCVHREPPETVGYVQADVSFDLDYSQGKYREIFLTARGPVPSAFVDFRACALN